MCAAILVVDDDDLILDALSVIFEMGSHEVASASSTEAAITALSEHHYDVVITDSMHSLWDRRLPAVQALMGPAQGTPIVLFTSHVRADDVDLDQSGLAAIWPRPMALDQILDSLQTILGR